MRSEIFSADALVRLLQRRIVATMDELKKALGSPVDMTVFRKLRSLPYLVSYSDGGRYYALKQSAEFDERGLWTYRGVRFSQFGFFPPISTTSPMPLTSLNPGQKGLRFAHFPAWHQPFFIGWLMVNKTSVWDTLAPEQQVAIEQAARDSLEESHSSSKSLQCKALKAILKHNVAEAGVAALLAKNGGRAARA